jgi:Hg(II)-responsive transcriptional regulator
MDSVSNPRVKFFFAMPENTSTLTIGRLARAANVGIETIRYYQRRELLPTPEAGESAFRTYPMVLVERIRFIKRAQELGFSLEEIALFLKLEDGSNRSLIRKVAADRLAGIRAKIEDLKRMETVLATLIHECEVTGRAKPCPIIAAMANNEQAQ